MTSYDDKTDRAGGLFEGQEFFQNSTYRLELFHILTATCFNRLKRMGYCMYHRI